MAYDFKRASLHVGQSAPTPTARGRWAYIMGFGVCENPYSPGTFGSLEWQEAWYAEKQDTDESMVALIHERGRLGQ